VTNTNPDASELEGMVMTSEDWAEAAFTVLEVSPDHWEWWFQWHDGVSERRVRFRAHAPDESRCDVAKSGSASYGLASGHPGPHVPISPELASLPFVIAP
jgi:hypothetical protein